MYLVTEKTVPSLPPEPWVTLATVAKHLGFGRHAIVKMVKAGRIPATPYRNGKRTFLRFKLSVVDSAFSQQPENAQPTAQ